MVSDKKILPEGTEVLHIKNMVCQRCIMVVREQFLKLGISPVQVNMGEVVLSEKPSAEQYKEISDRLLSLGFEWMDDKRMQVIEKVKNLIIELVHRKNSDLKINLSDYLTERLPYGYPYLSALFSEFENNTIEKYFIAQKIERAKELIVYDELTLSEIADLLHYSSTAHLSNQFKKITGLTPSHFKKIGAHRRNPLDKV